MGDAWWGGPWPTTCAPGRGGPGGTSPPGIPQRRKGVGTPLGGRLQSPFDQRQRAAMARRQEAEVKTRAPRGRNPPLGVSPGADPRLRTPGTTSPPGLPQRAVAAPALGCGGGCGCSARRSPGAQSRGEAPRRLGRRQALTLGSALGTTSPPGLPQRVVAASALGCDGGCGRRARRSPGAQSRGEAPRRLARRQALTLGSALGTTSSPGATAARDSAVSRALRGRARAHSRSIARRAEGRAGHHFSPEATAARGGGVSRPLRRRGRGRDPLRSQREGLAREERCRTGPGGAAQEADAAALPRRDDGRGPRPTTAGSAFSAGVLWRRPRHGRRDRRGGAAL